MFKRSMQGWIIYQIWTNGLLVEFILKPDAMFTISIAQKKMLCRGGGRTDGHAEERRYSDGEDGGRSRHCEYHLLVIVIDGLDTVSFTISIIVDTVSIPFMSSSCHCHSL